MTNNQAIENNQQMVIQEEKGLTIQVSTAELINRRNQIHDVMVKVMKENSDYGKIPGCGTKPTLLKAGAEKLCSVFALAPSFDQTIVEMGDGHREYQIKCIIQSPKGLFLGSGAGSCSTKESKYRYRNAQRKCPSCGRETIIKGKAEYGGGYICYKNKGGCGAKFGDGDPVIERQKLGKIENSDIADVYNTVLKMAKKRALVDAVLTVTATSDLFTQDIEDYVEPTDIIPTQEQSNMKDEFDMDLSQAASKAEIEKIMEKVKSSSLTAKDKEALKSNATAKYKTLGD